MSNKHAYQLVFFLALLFSAVSGNVFLFHFFSFSLCSKLQIQTERDSAYFLEILAGNFMDVVQYNQDNRAFEVETSFNCYV